MKKYSLLFLSITILLQTCLWAQSPCLPKTYTDFISQLQFNHRLPERLLNGRTVLFYGSTLSKTELDKIQSSLANTGIDAIVGIEIEKLLSGADVATVIFSALQKREASNLVFFSKNEKGYECVITRFNSKPDFVSQKQSAWKANYSSLNELLLQLNRKALSQFKKQNLLISEQPELDFAITIINGSRMENFTADLRSDRMAIRLSDNEHQNTKLKNECLQYLYKLEFVADSISDAELRQKGFWYVLNCVREREDVVRNLLGYAPDKASDKTQSATGAPIFKFYIRKLEYNHVYLGKKWDAAAQWEIALQNFIGNLKQETNFK